MIKTPDQKMTEPGLIKLLLSPGALAVKLHRAAHRVHQAGHARRAEAVMILARFLTGVEINPSARIGERLVIRHGMGTVIGPATIGDDCRMLHGVTIGTLRPDSGGYPTIGDRVFIATGAVILGEITVGDDAVIAANAVVLKDVPAGAIAAGVPAQVRPR